MKESDPDFVETAMGCAAISVAFAITTFTVVGAIAILINVFF